LPAKLQQKFLETVKSSIKDINELRGIPITREEKSDLYDYITRIESDGTSRYQKDFNKNYVNNLIETALFLKLGDKFKVKQDKKAVSTAAKTIKQKLMEAKGTKITKGGSKDQSSDKTSSLDNLSKLFF